MDWTLIYPSRLKFNATSSRKPLLISPTKIIFLLPSRGLCFERYSSLVLDYIIYVHVFICKRVYVSSGLVTIIHNGVPTWCWTPGALAKGRGQSCTHCFFPELDSRSYFQIWLKAPVASQLCELKTSFFFFKPYFLLLFPSKWSVSLVTYPHGPLNLALLPSPSVMAAALQISPQVKSSSRIPTRALSPCSQPPLSPTA